MFGKDTKYNMDKAIEDIEEAAALIDIKVECQTILQLLVQKEIVTREEVQQMRATVRAQPKYKAIYEYLDKIGNQAAYYKEHPEEHLKDLFAAKMKGDL